MPFRRRKEPMGYGILLREWREEHDLSMREAADMTGVSISHWSRIESGERIKLQVETLLKLSQALDITVDEFIASGMQTEAATA